MKAVRLTNTFFLVAGCVLSGSAQNVTAAKARNVSFGPALIAASPVLYPQSIAAGAGQLTILK